MYVCVNLQTRQRKELQKCVQLCGDSKITKLEEMIALTGQCQKSARRSFYERREQTEIEDTEAKLKLSGSEMMSRGFKEKDNRQMRGNKLASALGFHVKMAKRRNDSVKHVLVVQMCP